MAFAYIQTQAKIGHDQFGISCLQPIKYCVLKKVEPVAVELIMNNFFLPTSRKVLSTFQKICQLGPGCPDGSSFCPLSSSGQENKCFGVGFGVFCVGTYPRQGCVTAE